jgi:hypothetical protein
MKDSESGGKRRWPVRCGRARGLRGKAERLAGAAERWDWGKCQEKRNWEMREGAR